MLRVSRELDEKIRSQQGRLLRNLDGNVHHPATVYVGCVDGFHFEDMYKKACEGATYVQPVLAPAGACVLDPYFEYPRAFLDRYDYPCAEQRRRTIIGEIKFALDHLSASAVALESHSICGISWLLGRSDEEWFASQYRGYQYLMAQVPGLRDVTLRFHHYFSDGKRKTFEVVKEQAQIVLSHLL